MRKLFCFMLFLFCSILFSNIECQALKVQGVSITKSDLRKAENIQKSVKKGKKKEVFIKGKRGENVVAAWEYKYLKCTIFDGTIYVDNKGSYIRVKELKKAIKNDKTVSRKIRNINKKYNSYLEGLKNKLVKDDMSDNDIVLAFEEWCKNNLKYNDRPTYDDIRYSDLYSKTNSYSGKVGGLGYLCVKYHEGVCADFCIFTRDFLNLCDIDCYIAVGNPPWDNEVDCHAWNLVIIDGILTQIDTTCAIGGKSYMVSDYTLDYIYGGSC